MDCILEQGTFTNVKLNDDYWEAIIEAIEYDIENDEPSQTIDILIKSRKMILDKVYPDTKKSPQGRGYISKYNKYTQIENKREFERMDKATT
tara:strand:- start:416 stop:691 length:276 start_codon:yes stop_codon:yes gene_type:complete